MFIFSSTTLASFSNPEPLGKVHDSSDYTIEWNPLPQSVRRVGQRKDEQKYDELEFKLRGISV